MLDFVHKVTEPVMLRPEEDFLRKVKFLKFFTVNQLGLNLVIFREAFDTLGNFRINKIIY